ncbi:hypothetical protein DL767_007439 [Monosporascus sp. MG133]|nr:hypothetical protein DL767_007439 [Monosporascus sp. MG133]
MSAMGIPAVFSLSISYYLSVIIVLSVSGVKVFGCGYVPDGMGDFEVGTRPVIMTIRYGNGDKNLTVVSVFGKSTYVEPILYMNLVLNLRKIESALPSMWKDVEKSTRPVISRVLSMATVANTSSSAREYLTWHTLVGGFGLGQSQKNGSAKQPLHLVMSDIPFVTASLVFRNKFCIVIESHPVPPSLAVPLLISPRGLDRARV